ncbi:MAG: hypothetical protein Q8P13_04265 [bacterium]|nr:hypothetical protein [bacterium]
MNRKLLFFLPILLFLVGVDVWGGVNFISRKASSTTESAKNKIASAESTKSKTTSWATYKNTVVGFEFSYLSSYKKPRVPTNTPPYEAVATGKEDNVSALLIGDDAEKGYVLSILLREKNYSLNDYFTASLALVEEKGKSSFKKTSVTIDGVAGLKVSLVGKTTNVIFMTKSHFIELHNHTPLPEESNESEFTSMINSFKFTIK